MAPKIPNLNNPGYSTLPDVLQNQIYQNIGKYARSAVLFAFEEIGGPQGLADWAGEHQNDFYTKLFPKIVARETDVTHMGLFNADGATTTDTQAINAAAAARARAIMGFVEDAVVLEASEISESDEAPEI